MKVKTITSSTNPLLKKIRSLDTSGGRKDLGLFLVEGVKMIKEALVKNFELVDIVTSKSFFTNLGQSDVLTEMADFTVVEDKIFKSLCTTESSCGILATAKKKSLGLKEILQLQARVLVIGECIQDPGNLGTMIRTALAFSAGGMILSKGSVDYFSPKVVRASMGAIFSLPIAADVDLNRCMDDLRSQGFRIFALDANADRSLFSEKFSSPTAFLFGNEGHGLSAKLLEKVDDALSIPINSESESLNVAVAMGIVLCHAANSRR
jgi:TrmH family RNA methyltransferase